MRHRTGFVGVLICASLVMGFTSAASGATQRLKVSSNGRFLVQANGKEFFWMGDTNWRLYKLTENQINEYLDDRKSKKFNVIQGPVLLHADDGIESTNAYGETNTDPSNPNEAWFQHIDYIVDAANDRGMYVALTVTWGDLWDHFSSNSQARNFGRWLGERYKNDTNVIWIVAGEYIIQGTGSSIVNRWHYLGLGLHEGSSNKNLISIHGSFQEGRQSSSVKLHNKTWLDFNMVHSSQSGDSGSGADNWNLITTDWKETPVKPTLDSEANYEQFGGWDAFGVRRRAYWSVFAGAFGHTYGANGVWQSYRGGDDGTEGAPQDTWDAALDYPGAADMRYLRRLIESRPMSGRKPSQSTVIGDKGGVPNRIQVTRGASGRYVMIYVPEAGKQFTVNMDRISGSKAKAWWFNPRNGKVTSIGSYNTSGTRTFTTPSSGPDWVLVLDDKSRGYSKPGVGGPFQ
jgi:hypothetical protein